MSSAKPLLEEQAYMQQRVENQLKWFEEKSAWNQDRYKRLRMIAITFSALIPLLVGFIQENTMLLKILAGLAGVAIAIAEGWLSLYKYQENWIQYRATAEALKRETFLYKTGAAEYRNEKAPYPLFVERIEAIIKGDTQNWQQYISKNDSPTAA
ncbi:MAG: DUF4231 domain-containing protein [Phaeodactylibacter sp.]|nr:DUF4231 domain-containing protein [Phaeodactylibacter sp.]MCB9047888.1 DUF4231 domain-containing protein [Lewinellaceae bacterium]